MATGSTHRFIMGKTMSPPFLCCFWSDLFQTWGNKDRHKISSSNFGPMEVGALECLKICYRLLMGKWCLLANSFIFYRILVELAGNQDRHKIWDKFAFGPDQTLLALEWRKFCGKRCLHSNALSLIRSVSNLQVTRTQTYVWRVQILAKMDHSLQTLNI